MKKLFILVLCILSIIFCTACNGKKSEQGSKQEVENSAEVGLPNPFEEVEKLEDAENLANFKLKINDKFQDYDRTLIEAIKGELIQVLFENSKNEIYFRKSNLENQDVSGDYNEYSDEKEVEYKGMKVTLKGEKGLYYLAIWSKGKFSYSFDSSNTLDEKTIFEFIDMVD